ncbi:hypothetical protein [Planotetraspora silvatica]|uniref:hypothetical protein n=1 Tax=Planotetraspora silvatica TaxID=234614 RepID=UPI0019510714|nr:hypothetical protein [Planotetraspora silvatica]
MRTIIGGALDAIDGAAAWVGAITSTMAPAVTELATANARRLIELAVRATPELERVHIRVIPESTGIRVEVSHPGGPLEPTRGSSSSIWATLSSQIQDFGSRHSPQSGHVMWFLIPPREVGDRMNASVAQYPYVIAWTGEAVQQSLTFRHHPEVGGLRLTYRDPHPEDWVYGVLRARHAIARGHGRPQFHRVHTLRQWRCMEYRLCQVCGRSAVDPDTGRTWWLLAADASSPGQGYTNAPPTCRDCIPRASTQCPQLHDTAAVYSAAACEPYAVLGTRFIAGVGGPVPLEEHTAQVPLDAFRALATVLAEQLVVRLAGLRREDLNMSQASR